MLNVYMSNTKKMIHVIEPKRPRAAQTILGLAHMCMIDSIAPHHVLCSSTHISHIIMCWNSAEWVVSIVSQLQLENI